MRFRYPNQATDPDAIVRIPIFREALINVGTPDEQIVLLADNKVYNIIWAYGPITRWLLNTGWFNEKEE